MPRQRKGAAFEDKQIQPTTAAPDEKDPLLQLHRDEIGKASVWESLGYIALALLVAYLSDSYSAFTRPGQRHEVSFYLGVVACFLFISIFVYLNLYFTHVRKIKFEYDQWKIYAPYAIPIATVCMLLSGLFFTLAFWPLWTYLTPFILFAEFLGVIAVLSFF